MPFFQLNVTYPPPKGSLVLLCIPLLFVAVRLCVAKPHASLDLPSTLGIWVRSRRSLGVKRAARAEAARADGRCWGGSMLTLLWTSTAAAYIAGIMHQVPGTWYRVYTDVVYMRSLVFCGLRIIDKNEMLFFSHTLHKKLHLPTRVQKWGHKQERQKDPIFEPQKKIHKKQP